MYAKPIYICKINKIEGAFAVTTSFCSVISNLCILIVSRLVYKYIAKMPMKFAYLIIIDFLFM